MALDVDLPDAFTERLNASFGPVAAGFVGSGAVTGLDAGASSNALGLALNTAAAGTYGGTVPRSSPMITH